MVKKILYILLATVVLITIYLTIFELLLYNFHSPLNSEISNPIAHQSTWTYLLKQHYVTFIDNDIFTIHEKRHLLDVKKLFEQTHTLWITFLSMTLAILSITLLKYSIHLKRILKGVVIMGIIGHTLLLLLALNFLTNFKLFHTLLFTPNTWQFAKNSPLIEWFPILYFQEFVILFMIISFSIFVMLHRRLKKAYSLS